MSIRNFDKRYSHDLIFGKFLEKENTPINIGSTEDAEKQFTRTVENLD
jgi:hypothetical protein